MRIYISGKITDPDLKKMEENLLRFHQKESELQTEHEDAEIFNPASLETDGWSWEAYLARDMVYIITNKPTLYMMKGWEESRGARLEHETALLLRLTIIYE